MTATILALLLAYIPAAGSLLHRTASRATEGGRSREVTLSGQLQQDNGKPQPASLILHFPLACRFEGAVTASVKSAVQNPVASEDGAAGSARDLLKLACPLIAYRGLSINDADRALHGSALASGADLSAGNGITRLGDRAVWVLGAGPHEPAKPQLWLYKDTSAPARLLAQGGDDLRLLQYGNPAAAEWFPRVIELWRGGQLAARFEVFEARGFRGADESDDAE